MASAAHSENEKGGSDDPTSVVKSDPATVPASHNVGTRTPTQPEATPAPTTSPVHDTDQPNPQQHTNNNTPSNDNNININNNKSHDGSTGGDSGGGHSGTASSGALVLRSRDSTAATTVEQVSSSKDCQPPQPLSLPSAAPGLVTTTTASTVTGDSYSASTCNTVPTTASKKSGDESSKSADSGGIAIDHMPFGVSFDGTAPVSVFFNKAPDPGNGSYLLSTFRGVQLYGQELPLPPGFNGFVLERGESETSWRTACTFNKMTHWVRDCRPNSSNPFLASITWTKIAQMLHAADSAIPSANTTVAESPPQTQLTGTVSPNSPKKDQQSASHPTLINSDNNNQDTTSNNTQSTTENPIPPSPKKPRV
ncbi:ribonuclease H2 subunit C [Pelomyxa schiedti]|nr:ribonuclease H2 subunit C [Pelomyxa schiedti]